MPYENNTYISEEGREYTRAIFHNMFKNDGINMDVSSVGAIVGHMRGDEGANFHQTLGMVKQFITGYRHKSAGESYDSGILVCPSCNRRDFMPFWEFVDFGFRNENDEWTSTVRPRKSKYSVGGGLEVFGYHVASRVRCNHATTCLDCNTTVTGHYSTCRYHTCSSSNLVQVGCGHEFSHHSIVNEYQASEWVMLGRSSTDMAGVFEYKSGKLVKKWGGQPFMWRLAYDGPIPQGQVLSDALSAFEYIPQLEIGYETFDKQRRPYGYKCPDPDCDFERYTPPNNESFDSPILAPSGYNSTTRHYSDTGSDGQPLSSGCQGTYNPNNEEQRGGLVNNMGRCPIHNLNLVPRVSIKDKPPKDWFLPSGTPKDALTLASSKGYSYGSAGFDSGKALSYDEHILIGEVEAYGTEQLTRWANSTPMRYPISSLLRMFVQVPKEVCTYCLDNGYKEEDNFFYSPHEGYTLRCQNCSRWQPFWRRPASDNSMMENPSLYSIGSPQPLEGTLNDNEDEPIYTILLNSRIAPDKSIRQEQLGLWSGIEIPSGPESGPDAGMSVMLCPNDKEYESEATAELRRKELAEQASEIDITDGDTLLESKLVNLKGVNRDGDNLKEQFESLQDKGEIPLSVRVNSRIQYLPNSITEDDDFVTITTPQLLKYRASDEVGDLPGRIWRFEVRKENIMLAPEDDSPLGESAPGYTYVVCEGRSRDCFKSRDGRRIIDMSSENFSYRDRNTGQPSDILRSYPRWTQTPEWDVRPDGIPGDPSYVTSNGDYLWNSDTHMAQDRYRTNTYLNTFMPKNDVGEPSLNPRYHRFRELPPPTVDVETSEVHIFYECQTCKEMWSIGDDMMAEGTYEPGDAVTEYYRRRGWVDEEGNVTKPKTFPQEALEAAQKRESDSISNLGIEDPNIRAMGRGNGLTAKEMLENKKLVVETDE
jgi:hypothetical protein